MARNNLSNAIVKIRVYVKENGGSPFIVGFMFLLIGAGVSLSAGFSWLADNIAVYAFYALVIGVILQIICFLKHPFKTESEAI